MDKIVDHLFVFDGEGKVSDFPGNYTIYRNDFLEKQAKEQALEKLQKKVNKPIHKGSAQPEKRKFTFSEKREFEQLGTEIANLEEQKNSIEELLNSGNLPHDELYQKSVELEKLKTLLDEKEFRWLELSEIG